MSHRPRAIGEKTKLARRGGIRDTATSSILCGDRPPVEPGGTDEDSLGPSDSSDSDALGTGDRASAESGL